LYVLRENYRRRPAILIEAGFITSAADRQLMEAPAYGLALGDALAEALRGPTPR
jgi:N-acetylmuramoyl-L-alanine amidase